MRNPTAEHRSRWGRRWLLLLLTLFGSLAVASPAAAHLDLASTAPADGAVMTDLSAAITVTFTKAAAPSGDGFTLYDARGQKVAVKVRTSDDGVTWKIRPAEALKPAARYGLKWKVAAGDAHPKTGTVTFRTADPDAAESESAPATKSGAHTGTNGATHPPASSGSHAGMSGHTPAAETPGSGALDAVLAAEDHDSTTLDATGAVARWVSFAGILVAVGALIVVITTLVGSTGDVRLAERVVRIAAGLAVVAALTEGLTLLSAVGTDVPWPAAFAVGLRLLAGTAMVLTLRLVPHGTGGRRSYDVPALPETPSGRHTSGGTRTALLVLTPPVRTGRVRGVPAHPITTATVSVTMLASFLFDGHTATVAPKPLIAAAALAHTAAGAVWVGGVVLLATLLLVRARAGVPTGAGELAVRFSVPATAAVVIAGVAGTALTMLIIDSPAELTNTPWGRILLIKLGLVTAVAIMGYVNNRYALPALDAWRPGTARLLRRTVAAEAAVMIAVLLVTAILVAAQT
jgi:copper transport protein